MSSWEPIPQAMQRHSGSYRSVPKAAQPKPVLDDKPEGPADAAPQVISL